MEILLGILEQVTNESNSNTIKVEFKVQVVNSEDNNAGDNRVINAENRI
ncbi:MAG: hypothetical protein U5K53_08590 [Halanaerobiales bacterium]|nr:hypothetical protein [Halanaerobiales bacterium]